MASVKANPNITPPELEPADVYGPDGLVELRIATGGAGQSGLLGALAEAFIQDHIRATVRPPFRVSWLASDTSLTFNALAQGSADVGITYHPYAEKMARQQGITDRIGYGWRDHWMLVGPKSNPARLPTDLRLPIHDLFALIFQAAIQTITTPTPIRFLSRYDKSANNIAESRIWTTIGQTPWSHPYSPWYHRFVDLPFGALRAASMLGEYTLVDRGTWIAIEAEARDRMAVFAEAFDAEEGDVMLNPAHALVGTRSINPAVAHAFVDWLESIQGGQRVVASFKINAKQLYSPRPGV